MVATLALIRRSDRRTARSRHATICDVVSVDGGRFGHESGFVHGSRITGGLLDAIPAGTNSKAATMDARSGILRQSGRELRSRHRIIGPRASSTSTELTPGRLHEAVRLGPGLCIYASRTIVTGPSLTSETCMRAPNTPRATGTLSAASAEQNAS